ncbi:MAG: tRNA (N6-isopentenyl adenosine(37)-C2)-methylthiotransferase MiaB [Defluviitaleaceae bacterium]|nr:tRNA (N6-isopentenyl adenosine(37)-C2)-methylthiotransferase MiaB [Defluviitaleaceae bacterium]
MEKWTTYYVDKMLKINQELELQPKAMVVTYGCQMNARDSEKLAGMLTEMGYAITEDEDATDLVIFNTCCVRENAENRLYGNLGNFKVRKEQNRNLKLVLCGCMMQQDMVVEKIKGSYPYVDVIFGTFNIYRFPQLLHTSLETKGIIVDIWQEAPEIIEDLPSLREFPYKAGVNIMYGCDNFCTFCIVPYVRGRERSRRPEDILAEVQALADDGVREIMLLGQNVNSYNGGISFAELLHKVSEVEGIARIRFISSHPKDVTDDVIEAIRDLPKVCNYLHLPFQAGSDKILENMNRKHTKKWYMDLVDKVKAGVPGIALTTDIMVGFPGETEEDFQDTLDIVRHGRFASAFTFIYSRRLGTPADHMDDQIPESVVKERFNRLLEEVNRITGEISAEKLGCELEVLVEGVGKDGLLHGRADDNSLVHFEGDSDLCGKLVKVKIIGAKTFYLTGEIM